MSDQGENYTSYVVIGLLLTLLIIAGLSYYGLVESQRLGNAQQKITQERIARGEEIYHQQCASCHGAQGEGGVGPALNNRTLLKSTYDNAFFSVIRAGVPNTQMPAWGIEFGGPLTDEDVRDAVAFIRHWEATAPEISAAAFTPDPARGALLFASTCAVCHGENGQGGGAAPRLNDQARLQAFPDDWYQATIRNGRPAKGMPTWGTVLSPNQVDDLVALIAAWREGQQVRAEFSLSSTLASAIFSLQNQDAASAALHVQHALEVAQGEGGVGKSLQENAFVKSQSDSQLLEFLLAGRPGTAMAGFQGRLTETEIMHMIALMRLWSP
jgi:mono/diheme cytochrome c family protein